MVVSHLQRTKRVLVALLLSLARAYNVTVAVNRDATDTQVTAAVRKTAASPVNKAKAKKAMTMNKCKEDRAKPKKELQAKVLHAALEQIAKLV